MKNTVSKQKIFFFVTLVLSVISVIIRTLLLTKYYDTEIGYYSRGTLLPAVHTVLLCVSIVLFVFFALATKKDGLSLKKFPDSAIFIFSSALCGFCLLISLIFALKDGAKDTLELVAALLALPSALYFLSMPIKNETGEKVRKIFSLFVPLWGTLNLALIYFDSYIAVNAPNKIIEQTAFVSVMLFFLYECGTVLGKPKSGLYRFAGHLAMLFTATASIPGMIAYSLGKIRGDYITYDIVFAAFFIFSTIRMLSLTKEE